MRRNRNNDIKHKFRRFYVVLLACRMAFFSPVTAVQAAPGLCLDNYEGNAPASGDVNLLVFLVSFSDFSFAT